MTILRHQICKVAVNAGLVIAATVFVSGSTMAADDPRTDLLLTEARSLVDLIRRIDHRSGAAASTFFRTSPTPNRYRVPYSRTISRASRHYGIPEPLIAAVIKCESNWNYRARSKANAWGLMQVLPQTARGTFGIPPSYLWDPDINIKVGTAYLRLLANRYNGKTSTVIAAYNAGPTRIDRGQTLPRETRGYIRCVKRWHPVYERALK